MIYVHRRSGVGYRKLLESFSVERQAHSVVYMAIGSGEIFDRDKEAFEKNFILHNDPQDNIVPKDKGGLKV